MCFNYLNISDWVEARFRIQDSLDWCLCITCVIFWEVVHMYHMEGNFWVTCQLPSLQTLLTRGCLKIKQDGRMRGFLSAGGGLGADGEQEQRFSPYLRAVASPAQAFLQFRLARHWPSNAYQPWSCWQHGQALTIMLRVRQCCLKYFLLIKPFWQNLKIWISAWTYEIPGALCGTHSQILLPRKEVGYLNKLSKLQGPRL